MTTRSRVSVLSSVGVLVLGLSFFMVSNGAVAQEAAIPLASYEKLLERLEKLESELAELKNEKKKQDSMVEAELAEMKHERKKQEGSDTGSSGYYAQAELLYLKAFSSRETASTVHDTGLLGAGETSFTEDFESNFDASGRYEVGYMPQQGLGWAARYWHFNQSEKSQSFGDIEANFFDDPDIAIDDNGFGILAKREFNLNAADLVATLVTKPGNTTVKYSAGLRGVDSHMQGFWTDHQQSGSLGGERVRVDNNWRGGGPLLGVHVTHPLYQKNSSIFINGYAGGSAAMLFGNGDLVVAADRQVGGAPDDVTEIDRDGVVYSADLRLGLEGIVKPSPKSSFEFFTRLGLEGQYWANIGTVAASVSGGKDSDDGDFMLDADLGLGGFNAAIGVRSEFD